MAGSAPRQRCAAAARLQPRDPRPSTSGPTPLAEAESGRVPLVGPEGRGMGLTRRNLVAIAALALALLLPCGSAFAAPPSEPPGKSGDAPGQQDRDQGASEQQT